jgi:6-phosphofructokinase
MLILHECMGRDSGYLTAQTTLEYRKMLAEQKLPTTSSFPFVRSKARDVHAIWIPELSFDLLAEGKRLLAIMDEVGCVNVFFGEGTGIEEIVKDMEAAGETVPRDAFGHVSRMFRSSYFNCWSPLKKFTNHIYFAMPTTSCRLPWPKSSLVITLVIAWHH